MLFSAVSLQHQINQKHKMKTESVKNTEELVYLCAIDLNYSRKSSSIQVVKQNEIDFEESLEAYFQARLKEINQNK